VLTFLEAFQRLWRFHFLAFHHVSQLATILASYPLPSTQGSWEPSEFIAGTGKTKSDLSRASFKCLEALNVIAVGIIYGREDCRLSRAYLRLFNVTYLWNLGLFSFGLLLPVVFPRNVS
jgi:hypothetical protein